MAELEPETLITQWRNLQHAIDEFLNFPDELPPHTVALFKQTSLAEIRPGNTEYQELSLELETAFGKELETSSGYYLDT